MVTRLLTRIFIRLLIRVVLLDNGVFRDRLFVLPFSLFRLTDVLGLVLIVAIILLRTLGILIGMGHLFMLMMGLNITHSLYFKRVFQNRTIIYIIEQTLTIWTKQRIHRWKRLTTHSTISIYYILMIRFTLLFLYIMNRL